MTIPNRTLHPRSTIVQNLTPTLDLTQASFGREVKRRIPWILLSVGAGMIMLQIGRQFEHALAQRIELVLFIPMIVYLSDSIGTETLALFVRELALERIDPKQLLVKEILIGLSLGLTSAIPMGIFSYLWLKDLKLSLAVGLAMTLNGLIAVVVGMLTPIIFARLGRDPALGTDEITTAVSDNLSMLIYLVVATLVLF